jgi:hypothetical protein
MSFRIKEKIQRVNKEPKTPLTAELADKKFKRC